MFQEFTAACWSFVFWLGLGTKNCESLTVLICSIIELGCSWVVYVEGHQHQFLVHIKYIMFIQIEHWVKHLRKRASGMWHNVQYIYTTYGPWPNYPTTKCTQYMVEYDTVYNFSSKLMFRQQEVTRWNSIWQIKDHKENQFWLDRL